MKNITGMNQNKSNELYQKSSQYFPGGVNSPVRAFKSVDGTPLFIKKGKGAMPAYEQLIDRHDSRRILQWLENPVPQKKEKKKDKSEKKDKAKK